MPTCITSWGKPSASGGWEPIDKCFSLSVLKGIILRGIFALHRQFRWNRAPVPHSNAQLNLTPRSGFSSSPSCLFASVPSVPQKAFLFSASAFRAIRLSEAGESTPDKQISSQDEWQQGLCCWWSKRIPRDKEKAMAPHSSTLAWKIPWIHRIPRLSEAPWEVP